MRLAIFGSTGGTGRQVVEQALTAGHSVRALVRGPDRAGFPAAVELVTGNVLDPERVGNTVDGADAVLSCLGAKLTATFTRRGRIVAPGTAHIVEAMRSRHVRRLIVLSTYGAGDSWQRLKPASRLVMGGLLWGELADKNAMETIIRGSGLDWTILRPVNLKDGPPPGHWQTGNPALPLGFGDWVARADIAACMLAMLADPDSIGRTCIIKSA